MARHYFHLDKTERTLIKDWKNRGYHWEKLDVAWIVRIRQSAGNLGAICGAAGIITSGAPRRFMSVDKTTRSAVPFENEINKTLRASKVSYRMDTWINCWPIKSVWFWGIHMPWINLSIHLHSGTSAWPGSLKKTYQESLSRYCWTY